MTDYPGPGPVFEAVVDVVADELFARIAVRDRFETADDARKIAELIADSLVYRFDISERGASPQM